MKNVAVFFGGISVEHDVSVITGVLTVNTLYRTNYNPIPVYVDFDGKWFTGESLMEVENFKNLDRKKLTEVCFIGGSNILYKIKGRKVKELCAVSSAVNCMHGERGEDGSLSGFLSMHNIPVASPDIFSSSVCMDKVATKIFLKGLGVKVLPYVFEEGFPDYELIEKKIGYPVIIKPAKGGSSIGINVANNREELEYALLNAFKYSNKIIAEKCLMGFTEINCAVYKNSKRKIVVSECEMPKGKGDVLSFDDKYKNGERIFPADIDKRISDKIKRISEKIYKALDTVGVIRIDFMIYGNDIILNEINTVPGSLAYYLFTDTLQGFSDILSESIKLSEKEFALSSSLVKKYDSSVLDIKGVKSSKRL